MKDFLRLDRVLRDILRESPPGIREVRQVTAIKRILDGEPSASVCSALKLQKSGVVRLAKEVKQKGLDAFIQYRQLTTTEMLKRRSLGIAQMLLGTLAEKRFDELSAEITGGRVISIEDHRPSRSDTDYRLLNGGNNPICRLNIKFHGTLFREAPRYVGLDSNDCFALATYKINNALRRQEQERLPYVFLVLSIPELNASMVAELIPADYVWALAVLQGKRILEEAIVDRLREPDYRERFQPIFDRMTEGQFRIISAKRAYNLLRDKLFERVHALTLKSFTRRFRNAEVDMHLSLRQELTPIRTFLELLVQESPQKFAVRLYIGDY